MQSAYDLKDETVHMGLNDLQAHNDNYVITH